MAYTEHFVLLAVHIVVRKDLDSNIAMPKEVCYIIDTTKLQCVAPSLTSLEIQLFIVFNDVKKSDKGNGFSSLHDLLGADLMDFVVCLFLPNSLQPVALRHTLL